MTGQGRLLTTVLLLLICGFGFRTRQAEAQSSQPGHAPSSASGEESSQSAESGSSAETEEANPVVLEMPAVAGTEELAPGPSRATASYIISSFQWTGFGDTNTQGGGRGSEVETFSRFMGRVSLRRVRRRSTTNFDYAGGASFYNRRFRVNPTTLSAPVQAIHRLGVTQSLQRGRWALGLVDNLTFLPESPFGFAGFAGFESVGAGVGGAGFINANPLLEPNQTISTGSSRRISNVGMTQMTYEAGRRSSISATAAYGTLNFLGSGFINSNYWLFLGGYHFYLGRIDTLSIAYVHNFTRFNIRNRALPLASGESLGRGALLSYGRRLTGKLSLQLSGGPIFTEVAQPQGGIAKSTLLSTYDSLVYQYRTNDVNFSFMRNSTGGSGVLFGAKTDVVQLALDRQISRSFNGTLEVGHAFNQSLGRTVQAGQSAGSTQSSRTGQRSKFETWEAGVTLSRRLRENTRLFMNYHLELQSAIIPACFVSNCGETVLRHLGGIGINWSTRPIKLD
jgi:hypothetical protein